MDDTVTVVDDSDPDWTLVETASGAQGYWPKNFLEFLSADPPAKEVPVTPPKPAALSAAEQSNFNKVEIIYEVNEGTDKKTFMPLFAFSFPPCDSLYCYSLVIPPFS